MTEKSALQSFMPDAANDRFEPRVTNAAKSTKVS